MPADGSGICRPSCLFACGLSNITSRTIVYHGPGRPSVQQQQEQQLQQLQQQQQQFQWALSCQEESGQPAGVPPPSPAPPPLPCSPGKGAVPCFMLTVSIMVCGE
jgi:hypothetical protein